ncbi:M23 family metallopeptidase [Microbacterium sp.]|uniref:M23 family metallopeptidase n=1 Tax=Microbacterium sp. TaxID=51671 RepID=UPI0039E5FCF9
MTPDTTTADAAQTRRDRSRPSASTPGGSGVLTRAEYRRLAAEAATESVAVDAALEPVAAIEAAPEAVAAIDAAPRFSAEDAAPAFQAADAQPESYRLDEFESAARLFSFTGETPLQQAAPVAEEAAASIATETTGTTGTPATDAAHAAPRRPRMTGAAFVKRVAAASLSVGVMAVVGLLAIGTTTPAAAVAATSTVSKDLTVASASAEPAGEIQAFVAPSGTQTSALDRPETYNVASMADIAAEGGVTMFSGTWVNDPSANIQWPFPVGVPISAAYNSNSYLSEFSTTHNGVDLTPGEGAEVHVIAAGTVRIATEAGGDYGVTVVVDHIIDGQLVSTRYAHMQYGSLKVEQGDTVEVGEVLGTVGQTGKATGPHLHFEVLLGGTTYTDPIAWMEEHTSGTHTVG